MSLFKNKYRVESARLKNWDYSSKGYYFITICTANREPFFGRKENGKMKLSEIGKIAVQCWQEIPRHFPNVQLDEFIVMPNHVHGIIIIGDGNKIDTVEAQNFAPLRPPPPPPKQQQRRQQGNKFGPQSKNLASIIRGYKIGVTKWTKINNMVFAWQPRFYDHIIRNKKSLDNIRQYIVSNPSKWASDRNNPDKNRLMTRQKNDFDLTEKLVVAEEAT